MKFLAENTRGLLFTIGGGWLYMGICGFNVHAADIFAGAVLMMIGAVPYVRKRKP